MILLLGIACLTWTLFELARLAERTPRTAAAAAFASPKPSPSPSRAGRGHRPGLRAWDDAGRSIQVEDLGARRAA